MSSILLVEDHKVFAEVLYKFLTGKEDFKVIDIVGSAEEALARLPDLDVDLILVDVSLPVVDGIELVAKIHQDFPQLRCLMLSGHISPMYLRRALEAGARGYILKDDLSGILEGIHQVLHGEIYVSKSLRMTE
jgi:DNA-binding NarL/FixJ family response regulator